MGLVGLVSRCRCSEVQCSAVLICEGTQQIQQILPSASHVMCFTSWLFLMSDQDHEGASMLRLRRLDSYALHSLSLCYIVHKAQRACLDVVGPGR